MEPVQNNELVRLIEERASLRRLSTTLPDLGAAAQKLGLQAEALRIQWRRAQSGVQWRERFGLLSRLVDWFQSGRLEWARQECNRALLEYRSAEARHRSAVQQLERTEADAARLPRIEKDVARLLEERERRWKTSNAGAASVLQTFEAEESRLRARLALLGEALIAADTAAASLDYAIARMTSARSWGRYDIIAGGSFASWVKRSRMDEAAQAASGAGMHLRQFHDALEKLGQVVLIPGVDVQIGSLFFDVFFDNIFTDLSVQGRIREALDRLTRARGKLAQCHQNLDAEADRTLAAVQLTVEKREAYVLALE